MLGKIEKAAKKAGKAASDAKDGATGKKEIEKLERQLKKRNNEIVELQRENKQMQLDLARERAARQDAEVSLEALKEELASAQNAERAAEEKKAQEAAAAALAAASYEEETKTKAVDAAGKAYKALTGKTIGIDEKALARAICENNTNQQIAVLSQTYISQYGKPLRNVVKKSTSGAFRAFLLALMDVATDRPAYIAGQVKTCFHTMSTDTPLLIDLLCTQTNEELEAIKAAYQAAEGKDLGSVLDKALSGDIKKMFTILMQCKRDSADAPVDDAKVKADAQALYDAGQGKTFGCDELVFVQTITNRSRPHLAALNEAYKAVNSKGLDLREAVDKKCSGDLMRGLNIQLRSAIDRPKYMARVLLDSMEGMGFDEAKLVRTLALCRDTPEWEKIVTAYNEKNKDEPLTKRIISETKGLTGPSELTYAMVFAINDAPADWK